MTVLIPQFSIMARFINDKEAYPKTHNETARIIVPIITHSFLVTGPMRFSFSAANAGASGVSFISGGKILYSKYGVASKDTIAGKLAALNQDTHGLATIIPSSSASFKHNRFCAAAVRKRALELLAACQGIESKLVAPKEISDDFNDHK
jgi:hypothetical protein